MLLTVIWYFQVIGYLFEVVSNTMQWICSTLPCCCSCVLEVCVSHSESFCAYNMDNASTNAVEFDSNVCAICHIELDLTHGGGTWVTLSGKGLQTLLHFSELKGDSALQSFLAGNPQLVNVHVDCRKNYTNKRRYEQERKKIAESKDITVPPAKQLRSAVGTFNWKTDCFFCGEPVVIDTRHPDRCDGSYARCIETHGTLVAKCQERNDQWAMTVLSRLNMCNDLVHPDSVYHRSCMRRFTTLRSDIPCESVELGRKKDESKMKSFEKLCEWLEDADDLFTLSELHEKLQEIAGHGVEVYCRQSLEDKLMEKYEGHIFLSQVCGRNNVVCFKNMASRIISDKWYEGRRTSIEEESRRVVVAAAKLIKAEIKGVKYGTDTYPLITDLNNLQTVKDWVPSLLTTFMENLLSSPLKQVAFSHCIVQAARP